MTDAELTELLEMSLPDLGLSNRLCNMLEKHDIITVGKLLEWKREDLFAIKNFGTKTLDTILDALADVGLTQEFAR